MAICLQIGAADVGSHAVPNLSEAAEELKGFHMETSKSHALRYFQIPAWMDTDKDGQLSLAELKEANHKAGMSMEKLDPEDIKKQFQKEEDKFVELDVDKNGVLSQDELIYFFHPNLDRRVSIIETKHLMEMADQDKDGTVSAEEFEEKNFPSSFGHVDANGDDKIDMEELHEWSAGILDFVNVMIRFPARKLFESAD
ncbi:unnamed protein product [Effrenium voratum]|nr:unnamed protein product [Effrenium voratum]